ncbi:MAG: M28 family peptidase [Dehalococcoidia bacterium]|nr:M28 family peptidase [Dehalococcoidia bacterium]
MKSRHALLVAVVVLVVVLVFIGRLGGGRFRSPSSAPRLTVLATITSGLALAQTVAPASTSGARLDVSATAISTLASSPVVVPSLTSTPTVAAVPVAPATLTSGAGLPGETRTVTATRTGAVSPEDLWADLAGFSNKSNQEREQYVAEYLFPKAGLADISRESVPYTGSFGPEYGNWDGLSNVIARRGGSLPESSRKLIVLGAHFDKVTYPRRSPTGERSDGIFDNGTGVTIIAKIIQALQSPLNDIEVVAFASEEPEPYFLGSRVYFGKSSERQRMLFFVNFDCLGRGNLALVEKGDPTLSEVAVRVADGEKLPLVWRTDIAEVASDNLIAEAFGVRTLYFTSDAYDWHNIHVPGDNLSAVNEEAYYRHYLISLQIVAYLDAYLAGTSSLR